ncbi:D-alanyl-D-alanine carboxypeptidase family protein [Aquibaculum arenosum]|uniref:serine-type D-Ala-D-Ala carboxypeptidase n=1 Tax=Aquibaculum arenosum TaxID=3032591 RepID=A0ABT5YNJ3_9PROT|nr:D-alanyl-D-alanine carboxypeptidase family protein [Fodinicurvata sp. CAU 1616]MDF2096310.1 D-alanyl-D-alanine carboxypeptidase [Fodinicurvata sp. CAU 1616]
MNVILRRLGMALLILFLAGPAYAQIDTAAREAYLVDATTGTVLLDKDGERAMPPASMSKIMTVYAVLDRIRQGRLSLEYTLPVSERAWRMGGSKMFVEIGDDIRVEDLLRGVIVQSGNDACVVLAEGLSGSEEAFANELNRLADDIGLRDSAFRNATGWPAEGHVMSARDLAHLAHRLITDFPDHYHYYSELEFTWNDIRQSNRNPLLYRNVGADGLKTGHTEEAGYGLTASAVQNDRRLILVVTGLESQRQRAEEAERLMRWGFREFENFELFEAGAMIEEADVWLGASSTVPLVAQNDVLVTMRHAAREEMTAKVVYDGPIAAPLQAGQQIATLRIEGPGIAGHEVPLVAGVDVPPAGYFQRIYQKARYLLLERQ